MALRIEINCYCNYRCDCKPIPETKVTKEEIAYNLMRCNPALARYFSNTISTTETVIDRKQIKRDSPKSYRSIVDEKNMNILLSDRHPPPVIEIPQQKNDVVQIKIDNFVNTYAQTSPRNLPEDKKAKQKAKKDPTEQEIREYYRQLKQTSRYLPNTAFKKYFNRPIFENYGRQNTKGTNDGIIYGNYLKTHNINPHLGENRPHDQQTFYHALISASPQKFLGPKAANIVEQQKGKNLSLTKLKQDQSLEKPIKRHGNNTDAIIMDNIHQHSKLNTLSQTKLSPKSRHSPKAVKIVQSNYHPVRQSPKNQSKSPKAKQIKSPQSITSQYVNKVQHIQAVKPAVSRLEINNNQVSPRNNLKAQKQDINKLSQIKRKQNEEPTKNIKIEEGPNKNTSEKCPIVHIRQNHMEHVLSKNCNVKKSPRNISKAMQKSSSKKTIEKLDFGPGSPKSCVCGSGSQCAQGKCECLLTKVKTQLKQMAQKDTDLNNRLIASARKSTLYKNFALNNGQNAKLNPHNYTPCGGEIYQK